MPAVMDTMENITLRLENGAVLTFCGRLFSEAVWNDEDSGIFTHHKLYVTDQNEHVYVIRKGGERRLCRAYRVSLRGDRCVVYDGRNSSELPFDMLMLAMRTLCGAENGMVLEQATETLRSAGC